MILFVYCAGGFGREIYDTARRANAVHGRWEAIHFIDDTLPTDSEYYGTRVYTCADMVQRFDLAQVEAVIANGEPLYRKAIYDRLMAHQVRLGIVVDPTAIVSATCTLEPGVILAPYSAVNSLAHVGTNVAVNTKAIVGHDIRVGAHSMVSSMVNIGGASEIGEQTYLGMGCLIKEGLKIGRETIVGMGSVVYNDIPDAMIALGNPARPMRPNVDKLVFKKP